MRVASTEFRHFEASLAIFGLGSGWRSGMLHGYGRFCRCNATLAGRVLPGSCFCHAGLGGDNSQATVTWGPLPDLLVCLLSVHLLGDCHCTARCAGSEKAKPG